jgi:hypothetical protein
VNKKIIENVFTKFYSNFKLIFVAEMELLPPQVWVVGRVFLKGGTAPGGIPPQR